MKTLRHFLSFLILIMILLSTSMHSFAAGDDVFTHHSQSTNQDIHILTREETLQILQEKVGLTPAEAIERYNEISTRGVTTGERYITVDIGMGYAVEVGCLVEIEYNGRSNFGEILEVWSEPVGSGSYAWNAFYAYATVQGIGKDEIRFQSRGNFEVSVDISASAGFEAAGFTLGGTVGTTSTFRKTVSIDEVWRPGM